MSVNKLLTSRAIIGSIYNRLTAGSAGWVDRYSMKISSSQETETYAWLGQAPVMREWIGGREAKQIREFSWAVTNKDHEATLEILTKDLRRDMSGQIMIRVGDLARRVLTYPARLMSNLMIAGESALCYDGQYFFDTDHVEGDSGSQSNDIVVDISDLGLTNGGTATAPSAATMAHAIMRAITAIVGFRDDQGEPMNEGASEFDVMVPTSLYMAALAAVKLPIIDGGDSNLVPAQGDFKINVIANPRLTWTTKFAVYRTDAETKPFILQEEVPVNVSAVAEGSELEFKERKHWYGVDWAGNVAYGFWQHACLVTLQA